MSEEPRAYKSLTSRQESEDCRGCAEGSFVGLRAATPSSKVKSLQKNKISLGRFEAFQSK